MFKLNITHTNIYSEVGQPNPMRWRLMFKEEDGSLSSQSGLIACKDFFNDVVAWKQEQKEFQIYRFDNKVKFNEEGMYMVLSNISNVAQFIDNIFTAINPQLGEDLGAVIEVSLVGAEELVLMIPNEVWESTYYISVVSMMIRLCNYNVSYTDWDSFFVKDAPINTIEQAFKQATKDYVAKNGFKLPEEFQKYWYFSSYGYNSESGKPLDSHVIHNNGANDWVCNMAGVVNPEFEAEEEMEE